MTREELWAKQLLRSEGYAKKVDRLIVEAIKEAIRIAMTVKPNPDKPFQFSDFPILTERVKRLFTRLAKDVEAVILTGEKAEWLHANAANDALVDQVLKTLDVPKEILQKYRNQNLEALATFQQRKTAGMNLSTRVWNLTQQFQGELEMALDIGLGEGRTAQQLSQDVRAYLNEPAKLFRRVRDKRGQLQLSKAAKNYHPGQGVYRSSYKNSMRLTRTEINMAYRDADYQRWQDLDFVVGFQIKRSNHFYDCSVCDSLAGRFPKQFKFIGWHPHCRCYAVPILATKAEMNAFIDAFLADEPKPMNSSYEVGKVHQGYSDWVKANAKRVMASKNQPYFIKHNHIGGKITGGLKLNL